MATHEMSKAMKASGFTVEITKVVRGATLRSVFFTMTHLGYKFEMTSWKGGTVELYREHEGVMMYYGTVRRYAPGEELRAMFREVWYEAHPSKAAREAFERSATMLRSEMEEKLLAERATTT